ncbi:unnamed protein product [Ixodes pacificus]
MFPVKYIRFTPLPALTSFFFGTRLTSGDARPELAETTKSAMLRPSSASHFPIFLWAPPPFSVRNRQSLRSEGDFPSFKYGARTMVLTERPFPRDFGQSLG